MLQKTISIETTNKVLSSFSGLRFFSLLIQKLNIEEMIKDILPSKRKEKGLSQWSKWKALLYSFILGADCLDDLEDFRNEPLFDFFTGGTLAATTMGDFLRSFSLRSIQELEEILLSMTITLRKALFPSFYKFVLTMDSTPHIQRGKKIEGVAFNYANLWCLDSLDAYDEYGLAYGFQLRPGNTYSSNGAEEMIYRIFRQIPRDVKKFFRADSAFAKLDVYNALLNADVKFAIALKENIYRSLLIKYGHNIKWKKYRMDFFGSDWCQMGSCLYPLADLSGRRFLKVLFIRAPKNISQYSDNPLENHHYYALVTNIGQHEMHDEKLVDFYRKRSDAENFIRDQKYGLDLLHFPCKKLSANRIYGLVGVFAYNMMRFASFLIDKKRGCFIKKVRRTLVFIPCLVVNHARYLILKMRKNHKEVLEGKIFDIHCKFKTIFHPFQMEKT